MLGIPGTGLGGIFYLICAAIMIGRELWRKLVRALAHRWRDARDQIAIAFGSASALYIVGLVVDQAIAALLPQTALQRGALRGSFGGDWFASVPHALITIVVLGVFLTMVEILSYKARTGRKI